MRVFSYLSVLIAGLFGNAAFAQLAPVEAKRLGFAQSTGMLFGEKASEEMISLTNVAELVGVIMVVICVFVLALLIWVAVRYNARANPTPSKTTHSTILEVLWTGVPTVIVIFVGFLGVRQVIEFERELPRGMIDADGVANADEVILEINVNGMTAWNWEYDFVHYGDEAFAAQNPDFYDADLGEGTLVTDAGTPVYKFASNMLEHPDYEKRSLVSDDDRDALLATWSEMGRHTDFYQFDVDNRLVIPSGVRIQVNVQGAIDADKQHAWAVPAFGVKRDFWPGRVNSAHFLVREGNEGLYFGQCSEFCGAYHAFMPIAVHVVTLDEFRDYFGAQMDVALAALETGGVFEPEYLPVILPAPYGATSVAQR